MAAKRKPRPAKPAPLPEQTWIVLANGQEIAVSGMHIDVTDGGTLICVGEDGPLKVFAAGAWSTVTLKPEPA